LNALEQEIREIRKAVTQETKPFPKFPAIKQEQQQQVEQAERQQAIEQAEAEFNCTLCSVTKPINQRERERERERGKNKNQVYANSVLIIGLRSVRQKSKNDGTSRYECVCESTFQRWGLSKHEQTNKHKLY